MSTSREKLWLIRYIIVWHTILVYIRGIFGWHTTKSSSQILLLTSISSPGAQTLKCRNNTVSQIALEANGFMCICVGYFTHYGFPAVSFGCQTSMVVAAVTAVSYCIVYMWHAIVSHYVLY
jgi:hypothetical protein